MASWTRGMLAMTLLVAAGCGGGKATSTGPTTSNDTPLTGIALPSEISALPPKAAPATPGALSVTSFAALADALAAADLPAGSDYATAQTVKWVNEQALSRFDVLSSIFSAVGQARYADEANVNAGPYGAMVSAVGGGNDSRQKSLELWVVDSTVALQDGAPVNVIRAWIEEEGRVIPARLEIRQPPTRNADGSYADYGVWTITADLALDGSEYFVATSEPAPGGGSIVKVHNTDGGGGGSVTETRGILHRSGTSGYGKVSYGDSSLCSAWPCTPPIVTVAYAYDGDVVRLEIQSDAGTRTVFKDRNTTIDLVERYGLYDEQGRDVAKLHRFGFPIQVDGVAGAWGYYGAWQGRHQIWAGGDALPEGTAVVRADRGPQDPVERYTASKVYEGILVKRTFAAAQLSDIQGVVVQTWDWRNVQLQGDGTQWRACQMLPGAPPDCSQAFTAFGSLVPDAATQVSLQGSQPMQPQAAVAVNGTLDGFVLAGTSTPFAPAAGAAVFGSAGGPLWIAYTGTGWVKKEVLSVDQNNQPTFGSGAAPYTPPDGRDLYLNNMGVNYLVRCTSGACTAQLENQAAVNPANATSIVAADTVFTQQAWGLTPSQFRLVLDPADPRHMKLVYTQVGEQDARQAPAPAPGDVVTTGQWNMTAPIDGVDVQFSWEYPQQGGCTGCGVQQFLVDGQGQLVILEDPIRLAPVELRDGAGAAHVYSLSFDGSWVGGLPDLHQDLQSAGYEITPAIQARAVAIPSGTAVTSPDGLRQYFFRQLQVSEYLATIPDPGGLDVTAASALDLSTVPAWAPTGLGARPDYTLRYSEGVPVE